uniref:flavodoxin family protein n=1 Tax=Lactobacillus acidophilus TaxID=1579 RepID=UPI003F571E12
MKKVFCYSGSSNPKSITRRICSQLLVELNQLIIEDVKVKIYDGCTTQILPVKNADSFFLQDNLDDTDPMKIIKKDILNSQIIILGSPVYFHNVSGNMKNFIDQLSYMTHLFPLIERKVTGVIVVCGSYYGSDEVVKYLMDFEEHLGLGNINTIVYNSNRMSYQELRKRITSTSLKVSQAVNKGIVKHSDEQINTYNNYFNYYTSLDTNTKETHYWSKRKRLHKTK